LRVPLTVVAFAVLVAAVLGAVLALRGLEGELVVGGPVLVLATFGLVIGVWWAWLFLTIAALGDLVLVASHWPAGWALAVNVTMLALLLAPPTRRFARRGRPFGSHG
jgi:hypothetical protein